MVVRENADRGDDSKEVCNPCGCKLDESFIRPGSDLIVDDGDIIEFELFCFVLAIRIVFVIFAAPFESDDDEGEFVSCLHPVEVIVNKDNE